MLVKDRGKPWWMIYLSYVDKGECLQEVEGGDIVQQLVRNVYVSGSASFMMKVFSICNGSKQAPLQV